jgi:hypothetical protein
VHAPRAIVRVGPPAVAEALNHVVMALALALLVAGLLPAHAAPSSMGAARPERIEVRGLLRITRHPFNAAAALFGVAHLLVNGHLGDVLFFAGFPSSRRSAPGTRTSASPAAGRDTASWWLPPPSCHSLRSSRVDSEWWPASYPGAV